MSSLAELIDERRVACRLTPERALETLDEAEKWVLDRGIVTGTPDCSLPSLHTAIHEEPYEPGGRGFASYPKTKWWWGGALAARPGIHGLKLHRGKGLYVSEPVATLADPLCRRELARAEAGEHGPEAVRLVALLREGPALVDDLKAELGLDAKRLRTLRDSLERLGVVVSTQVVMAAASRGHQHTSELSLWDALFAEPSPGGLGELLVAGVRAAVVAPEPEARRWFSWRVEPALVDELVAAGKLSRPEEGWLCLP